MCKDCGNCVKEHLPDLLEGVDNAEAMPF